MTTDPPASPRQPGRTTIDGHDSTPVFVDQSGTRGRRLRGLGWLLGLAAALLAAAAASSVIGLQSQAPDLDIPPPVATDGAAASPAATTASSQAHP